MRLLHVALLSLLVYVIYFCYATLFHITEIKFTGLIYVHRCFFAQAIETHPEDPMKSPYAPSFLAGYRAACDLIASMTTQFSRFPAQIARLWVVWTHGFSASIMLMFIVSRACGKGLRSKLTEAAFAQAAKAVGLFEQAATYGGRAKKVLVRTPQLYFLCHDMFNILFL